MTTIATKICERCVMDSTDPDIVFFDDGTCNHCRRYYERVKTSVKHGEQGREALAGMIAQIKSDSADKEYDCLMGLSGGVDSSYVALLAKRYGLRPLVVHFDNGWNSEIAVQNIKNTVSKLGFDLYTYVVDWEEFKDIQRAFFKANVVDIEMITDHAIKATLFQVAKEQKINCLLSGGNVATEAIMPVSWRHPKSDLLNLKAIHRRYGTRSLKTYPMASTIRLWSNKTLRGVRVVSPLNYLDFNKQQAIQELQDEVDWRPYGGKHYESVFTRFYQGYILPQKFGIEKRKSHLSNLICAGQVSRDEALQQLSQSDYPPELLRQDLDFVCKKLDFTEEEFDEYVKAPRCSHFAFRSDQNLVSFLVSVRGAIRNVPFTNVFRSRAA